MAWVSIAMPAATSAVPGLLPERMLSRVAAALWMDA